MRTKQFITSVDKSLLTLEERQLRRVFMKYPKFTLEQAIEFKETGKVVKKEPEPTIEPEPKPVEIPVVKKETKPKPKTKPRKKAKAKPKTKKT